MNIRIGHTIWKVIDSPHEHQENRRGSTYKELREIHINDSIPKGLKDITLIHEILHACADIVGTGDEELTEEEWVKRIAPTLAGVIKENPELIKTLST